MKPGRVLVGAAVVGVATAAGVGWVLGAPGTEAWLRAALPVGRTLLDGLGVGAVGLAVLSWLVGGGQRRDVEGVRAAARRAGVVLAGGWAATALVLLWLQVAEVSGADPTDVGVRAVLDYLGTFGAGTALLVTTICAITYGVMTGLAQRVGALVVVAVLGLLPGPLTGHASTAPAPELAVVSVAVHATAAAVWVGGLGALLLLAAGRRGLLATALPRFSPIAAGALATVAASGIVTAAARLGSVPALVDTGYGRVVLAKTAALIALAVLGALVRRRVLPAVAAHRRAPLLALAGTELVIMATALGLAAALTHTPLT